MGLFDAPERFFDAMFEAAGKGWNGLLDALDIPGLSKLKTGDGVNTIPSGFEFTGRPGYPETGKGSAFQSTMDAGTPGFKFGDMVDFGKKVLEGSSFEHVPAPEIPSVQETHSASRGGGLDMTGARFGGPKQVSAAQLAEGPLPTLEQAMQTLGEGGARTFGEAIFHKYQQQIEGKNGYQPMVSSVGGKLNLRGIPQTGLGQQPTPRLDLPQRM